MKINIKQNIYKILSCTAVLLLTVGCSDFLDEEDPSNLTPDSFYTTAKHAESAIAAVYADARFVGNGAGIFSSNWQFLMAPTGITTTETAQNSDLNNLYSLSYDANTLHVRNWWRGIYKVIANANLVLENVPGIEMDEAAKAKVIGEARFLRAWAYFYAVRLWGDVPLITLPQSSTSEDFFPTRTAQSDVYALIVSDLLEAENAGLSWTDESGRVSQAAVKTLLSKVYLTMAGQPLNETARYAEAATKAKEVIDNAGTIRLFDTYGELHDENLNNTGEHIFSLQYNDLVAGNPMGNMFPNFQPVTYRGPSGTGSTIPDIDFYNSFEAGDLRAVDREGSFYTSYYRNGNEELFDLGKPYIFKHFNVTANGTLGVAGTAKDNLNLSIFRYAEVLLIYAEAANEAGSGPSQAAYDALKAIRDRAQLATADLGTFNQQTFREAVWKERWHELCFEMKIWFDMVRLRKVYNVTSDGFDDFVGHVNPSSDQALQDKHLLFPIPEQELINSPNLGTQNPGY
ncbi:RagB/SusD family nutrient uptake outer membrane protein [Aurantibacter crassamenti]|uniref:RagB/SusD family nutrient uptake outer membrane protein n=1 Tax=Aurantibacter crassamenti TaxID=1837375 RepID=UPI00193AA0B3|nr:RagB/SusD family nutrient uptake outer membrane protein [Aurantibacter crassamenti]MBM1106348.1 RagB/SusD family nutrient uptake outer membrane protein [Aurantibacter crassamenti]